jgi:ribose-phosphate pyrophosphokinase
MTMTLHSPQVHGFFSLPTDPLTARHLFSRYLKQSELNPSGTLVISPDMGRAKSAARFAHGLNLPIASAYKERISDHVVRIGGNLKKQVKGYRRALVYDDEIVTGTTVLELSKLLVQYGIEDILVICTHAVFSGNALQRLSSFPQISRIITTDTVPIPQQKRTPKLEVLSVAPVFGEAIWRNASRQSIGDLFGFSEDLPDEP